MQKRVSDFLQEFDLETDVESRMLDLVSETGEMAKEVLKSTNYGQQDFQASPDWEEELGDCLFSLCALAEQTDVDIDTALDRVLEKYRTRFRNKGDISSGR